MCCSLSGEWLQSVSSKVTLEEFERMESPGGQGPRPARAPELAAWPEVGMQRTTAE